MNINPEQLRPMFFRWMQTDRRTPSNGINSEFCDRLMVTLPNVSEQGPLVPRAPRLGPYQHPRVKVTLANVADFFNGIAGDFSIPEELKAMARGYSAPIGPSGSAGTLKRSVLINKYEPTWPTLERDLRDGHKNGLSNAAKVGANGLWFDSKALEWASARGKLRAKPELPVIFKPVVVTAVHHPRGKPRN
ncbi:MAG: hypothetical protein JJD98_01200 [Polaromonas sp.]|nr:hypothetical protein [Polaromonas sp.]